MTKIFFDIKQGSRPPLGYPTTRRSQNLTGCSPCLFLSPTPGTLMNIIPAYKDVPQALEKLKRLELTISRQKSTVSSWEATEPTFPLLLKLKEQLARNEQLYADITGGPPCQ